LMLKSDSEHLRTFSDNLKLPKLSISDHSFIHSDGKKQILSPTTSDSSEYVAEVKKGKRRGRPLKTIEPGSSRNTNRKIAHNMVERRYRDTLNLELEKLGQAVPCIAELDCQSLGRSRASKATVLASAVAYIKRLEARVDELSATG